jgi:hypothetical protein
MAEPDLFTENDDLTSAVVVGVGKAVAPRTTRGRWSGLSASSQGDAFRQIFWSLSCAPLAGTMPASSGRRGPAGPWQAYWLSVDSGGGDG